MRLQLLDEFNIEIAGGIGPTKGKIWRIGLMGYSCQKTNVLVVSRRAGKNACSIRDCALPAGAGVAAAIQSYQHSAQPAVSGRKEVGAQTWQTRQSPDDSPNVRHDERIHRRVRRPVEGDGLRVSLPLLALLERHRHAPQRYDGLQILRGWQGRGAWSGAPGFVEFRASEPKRNLSDREASYIAAEYLRGRLEQEDEHSLYDVSAADVLRIIEKFRIR